MTLSLSELENKKDFITRHIGLRDEDVKTMLAELDCSSLDDLIKQVVPKSILEKHEADIGEPMSEVEVLEKLQTIANKNKVRRSLIGQGYHDTILPNVILRNVLENPGWYTAYTPYQPEISQGRLEALLNFQQMIIDLTAMDIANASMLDEATAAAEAMTLIKRVNKKNKSNLFLVSDDCHPQTIAVVKTRAEALGIEIKVGNSYELLANDGFGLLLQYPATNGNIYAYEDVTKLAHKKDMLVAVASDLLSLTLLKPPGEWGADVVVGSAQRFGVPLGYGGPHAAFFAVKDEYKRSCPGRIVGVSVDSKGAPALRLALQTREQHIRRDKATSNICTAQVLLANIAGFYAVYHGSKGLIKIAQRIERLTSVLANGLVSLGFEIENEYSFDTVTLKLGALAEEIFLRAQINDINLRDFGDGRLGVSLDEKSTREEVLKIWQIFSGELLIDAGIEALADEVRSSIPKALQRSSSFLTHPVFNTHHSETEMLRYLRKLEQKDIALNRSMIPLGSCTMKLNATTEMLPVTWKEFSDIHPFAPEDQAEGYKELCSDLEDKLCKLTGFAAVSLQPNAGSQGEYAGLLAIKAYHQSNGDTERNICLIPTSAHGTNPASAVMASMEVKLVDCDENGNINLDDLKAKAKEYKDRLSALMVTYPSTHGVFEEEIKEICKIVHDCGGQVYMDGANFNAMVGLVLPAKIGADVMHMNLHKTFCIPHGGGGPGVGPIGVVEHLVEFLPGSEKVKAISAAPYGSASILPISWVYISLMGGEGLKRATQVAILNANYIAKKLEGKYETLYKGKKGFVAHECILDTRSFKNSNGVSVEDIAKRLMDFGFHAPTMSFPVPGTLMVEPTESESKEELDRFIAALLCIRDEIDNKNNILLNAPHTAEDIACDDWDRGYTRTEAVYPLAYVKEDKYWPPINRVDNATGDRNLICTCPPLTDYSDE